MFELQAVGVQEHAFEAELFQAAVGGVVAVAFVAGNRAVLRLHVHADLVGAAGAQRGFHQAQGGKPHRVQRRAAEAFQHAEQRVRALPFFAHAHHFLACRAGVFEQRQLHLPHALRPRAHAQRQIYFFRLIVAPGFVQFHQCAALFGHHQ